MTLDRNDTWMPHVPQALALKELWDQEVERTREERIRLQEGCFKLMKELGLSVETSGTQNNSKLFGTVVFSFKIIICICFNLLSDWFCYSDYQSASVENAIDVVFFSLSFISSSDPFTSVCDPSLVYLGVYWAHRNQPPLLQKTG